MQSLCLGSVCVEKSSQVFELFYGETGLIVVDGHLVGGQL